VKKLSRFATVAPVARGSHVAYDEGMLDGIRRVVGDARWLAAAALLFTTGCGAYEREPAVPESYRVTYQEPLTNEQLAARASSEAEVRARMIGAEQEDEYGDTDPAALETFKPALDGHGTWVDDPTYGTVWVPSSAEVGADFTPYVTAGRWTYDPATDYVWVSDYDWGWAPFHYGRWVMLPGHGWVWIPGRRYSGAWVTWRVGPAGYGYVGWAPAPPSWYWYGGVAYDWPFAYDYGVHYVYCPRERVYQGPSYVVRGPSAREHDGRTRDYVAASPTVGRTIATPSVGGGRVAARPNVGPRPDEIGVPRDVVVAPPSNDRGLAQARALAAPRVAALPSAGSSPSVAVGSPRALAPSEPRSLAPRPASPTIVGAAPSSPGIAPYSPRYVAPRPASPTIVGTAPPSPALAPSAARYSATRPASPTIRPYEPRYMEPRPSAPTVIAPSQPRYVAPRVAAPSVGPSMGAPVTSFRSPSVSAPMRSSPSIGSSPIRSSPGPRSVASPSVRKR
jgi:hypothetical protein